MIDLPELEEMFISIASGPKWDMAKPMLWGYFFLHVEKEEIHTPLTLHHRNTLFYALAERFEIESYDGMDVGPLMH